MSRHHQDPTSAPMLLSDDILASLHMPDSLFRCTEVAGGVSPAWQAGLLRRPPSTTQHDGTLLPLPPMDIRHGYSLSDSQYLDASAYTGAWLKHRIKAEGIDLGPGSAVLEWGCAAGRVIRQFAEYAPDCEIWGTDVDARKISWNKANLSPPFRFVTCTAYPHLPFEDDRFTLVYGISVFTHILHLADMWLQELCRITKPGGYALMTVLDEHSWSDILADPKKRSMFVLGQDDLPASLPSDMLCLGTASVDSGNWRASNVFYTTSFIRREWSQHFEIVRIEPRVEWYQTLVTMKKRS